MGWYRRTRCGHCPRTNGRRGCNELKRQVNEASSVSICRLEGVRWCSASRRSRRRAQYYSDGGLGECVFAGIWDDGQRYQAEAISRFWQFVRCPGFRVRLLCGRGLQRRLGLVHSLISCIQVPCESLGYECKSSLIPMACGRSTSARGGGHRFFLLRGLFFPSFSSSASLPANLGPF